VRLGRASSVRLYGTFPLSGSGGLPRGGYSAQVARDRQSPNEHGASAFRRARMCWPRSWRTTESTPAARTGPTSTRYGARPRPGSGGQPVRWSVWQRDPEAVEAGRSQVVAPPCAGVAGRAREDGRLVAAEVRDLRGSSAGRDIPLGRSGARGRSTGLRGRQRRTGPRRRLLRPRANGSRRKVGGRPTPRSAVLPARGRAGRARRAGCAVSGSSAVRAGAAAQRQAGLRGCAPAAAAVDVGDWIEHGSDAARQRSAEDLKPGCRRR